ncbi:MAG: hypothetical protein PHW73_10160 [Atribacterota bacterium]|nr:hypothetical protein [Atribacterota bacterium]
MTKRLYEHANGNLRDQENEEDQRVLRPYRESGPAKGKETTRRHYFPKPVGTKGGQTTGE